MRGAQSRCAICLAALQCQQQAAPGQRASLGFSCQRSSVRPHRHWQRHQSACDTSACACDTARRHEDHGESCSENCLLYSSCFSHVAAEYFIAVVSHISQSVVVEPLPASLILSTQKKRVERQIPGEWLLNSAQRQSKTFC